MLEAGVVLDHNNVPIYWHSPEMRTGGSLPDSRGLWDVLWENRGVVAGFAHTHPGSGLPGPSYTDVTTFAAVEAGLGRRLNWWILSSDDLVLLRWKGPDRLSYGPLVVAYGSIPREPEWVALLRGLSNYPDQAVDTVLAVEG